MKDAILRLTIFAVCAAIGFAFGCWTYDLSTVGGMQKTVFSAFFLAIIGTVIGYAAKPNRNS